MNEPKQEKKDEKVVVNIYLAKMPLVLLAMSLAVVTVMILLMWSQPEVSASPQQSLPVKAPEASGLRQYYRTYVSYTPTNIINACAQGYHFASLWEILDPSNLEYNNSLGDYQADSGYGPLSARRGWVRTGYNSSTSGIAGQSNCLAWTSDSGTDYGTSAELVDDWKYEAPDVGAWVVGNEACSTSVPVWCVED